MEDELAKVWVYLLEPSKLCWHYAVGASSQQQHLERGDAEQHF